MALPNDNTAKHHIGLGGYGFMLEGGYTKEIQRETSGSGQSEFGGNTDLIGQAPSLSRWTQDDFIGGMYAYNWGRDDAMFADCTGFMPGQQSRSIISCPPMKNVASGLGTGLRSIFMVGGSIYTCGGNTITRTQIGSWSQSSFNVGGNTMVFAEYDSQDQKIWCGVADGTGNYILRLNTDLSLPSVDFILIAPPQTNGWSFMGGTIFNRFVVTQFGRRLFVGDPPKRHDASTPGKIKWFDKMRLPGRWKDSLAYNNVLYILINDGSFRSSIYTFDGTDVMSLCSFPFNFYAKCLIEYAGRIFVGGTGTDVNGGEHYAELYEVTGASVRLVRTFSPETRNYFLGGVAGEWPQAIDDLTVHEGLLWICQKGKRMVAYDITSDAFFGAAEIQGDSSRQYAKMCSGRGRLWCVTTGGALDRIAQPADSVSSWNPTFISSDFTYEIAKVKNWSEIQVMSRYGSVASIEYSVNSGGSWTSLTVTNTGSGQVYFAKAVLSGITPSKIIRFRIKLTSTGDAGTAATYHRELVAFTVSFTDSTETQKKAWGITINGAREIETRDATLAEATTQVYDVSEVRDQLWTWANGQSNITLRDLDGSTQTVKFENFRELQPVIGPIVSEDGETIDNEAQYVCTLLEV